ncbi:protein N-lysine methyltransferase METTL21D-like [Mya arenaria]|uniref:protein N-lysine methyltransferase METTL21D-like n=1 Tax=Mya arenaria TaxID=6604 RepID=UPI0022E63450|nr:protein N-lysine methyltransferase METTL21D-like [Mya arenaria]
MAAPMKESNIFTRDLERNDDKVLKLKQYETGDVGCVVWDAAIVLAKYFEAADFQYGRFWKGKKVLELGSGTGAVGLLTASYGASTIITDLQDFVPLMNMNIETNKETFPDMDIKACELKWGTSIDSQQFSNIDVVVVADCIYYAESLKPLVQTMEDLCSSGTCVYCCYEERTTDNKPELQRKFLELVGERFTVEKIPLERQDSQFSSDDIHILRFCKKDKT